MPAPLSRRQFMLGGAGSALGVGLLTPGMARATTDLSAGLSRAAFEALVDEYFFVIPADWSNIYGVVITSIDDGPVQEGLDQFRVVFEECEPRAGFEAGYVHLYSWRTGWFDLSLQDGQGAAGEPCYVAAVTLLD